MIHTKTSRDAGGVSSGHDAQNMADWLAGHLEGEHLSDRPKRPGRIDCKSFS